MSVTVKVQFNVPSTDIFRDIISGHCRPVCVLLTRYIDRACVLHHQSLRQPTAESRSSLRCSPDDGTGEAMGSPHFQTKGGIGDFGPQSEDNDS